MHDRQDSAGPNRSLEDAYAKAAVFAAHAHRALNRASSAASRLLVWARDGAGYLGLVEPPPDEEDRFSRLRRSRLPPAPEWTQLGSALDARAQEASRLRVGDPIVALAAHLRLDKVETDILLLSVGYVTLRPVEGLWDRLLDPGHGPQCLRADPMLFAVLTGHPPAEVARRLHPRAPLRTSGLLEVTEDSTLLVLGRLRRLATEPAADSPSGPAALLGAPLVATLCLANFAHLGVETARVIALLRGALAERARGIHVLLHGPVGTGKSELARTLAQALGVPLYAVGETDEHGGEPTRGERLGELRLAQRLVAGAGPSLLTFDEAEDLFAGGDAARSGFEHFDDDTLFRPRRVGGSRAYMHRLLEGAPVPVIWTANSLRAFGPAVLRRMSCCIEMPVPPAPVRAALWKSAAAAEGVAICEDEIGRLARMLPAAPALARSALRAARLAGGDAETVRWAVGGVVRAMGDGHLPRAEAPPEQFDTGLLHADADLAALADRLAAPGAPRDVSLLLSGPPGTGKSAYVRHLAERMGMPVLQRRASDLLGRYVGETEQRIAGAFAEAAATRSFLIFDEADSLLGARQGADQPWQVSQVNEMLTWMERHEWPLAFTTNFADHLDAAVMRRVLLKVRFDYLAAAQVEAAFRGFFGMQPPAGLAALDRLTPADFALVRRVGALQGGLDDGRALLAALAREQNAKPGAVKVIGFRAAT